LEPTVGAKWVELLKEIAPHITRIAVVFKPETSPYSALAVRYMEAAARKLDVELTVARIQDAAEIETVMTRLSGEVGWGLILPPDSFTAFRHALVVEQAARLRLPAIYSGRVFADEGGLATYGVDGVDQWRQTAVYVDRILRGEKPADLPVQQPTKFELVINMKTAKALGLTIPETLLATADEVIQ
jgi:putative tryptophan/tyrosine transport system substrate-binding protein